jgi:hypothetical protein
MCLNAPVVREMRIEVAVCTGDSCAVIGSVIPQESRPPNRRGIYWQMSTSLTDG